MRTNNQPSRRPQWLRRGMPKSVQCGICGAELDGCDREIRELNLMRHVRKEHQSNSAE